MAVDTLRTFSRKLNLQNRILLITVSLVLFWGLFCFALFRWVVPYGTSRQAGNRGVELAAERDDRIEDALFDPFALHQCLLNLVSNALDAIPAVYAGRVVVRTFRDPEDRLCFKVTDNGTGMSREVRDKILRGMFSTKGSKGTGLGLLVVQKLVREHQERVEISSEECKGSEFLISLPYLSSDYPVTEQQPRVDGRQRSIS